MTVTPEELYLIGQIGAPFGLQGQVKLRAVTDHADYIEQHVRQLYIGAQYTPYALVDLFEHKPGLLVLTLEGITSREQAERMRHMEVFIHQRDVAPLSPGEYFLHQLYHLRVETTEGKELGQVREVLETGANDVLVVASADQREILIPMIRDVVQELDIAGGRVVVRLLDGLLPEQTTKAD